MFCRWSNTAWIHLACTIYLWFCETDDVNVIYSPQYLFICIQGWFWSCIIASKSDPHRILLNQYRRIIIRIQRRGKRKKKQGRAGCFSWFTPGLYLSCWWKYSRILCWSSKPTMTNRKTHTDKWFVDCCYRISTRAETFFKRRSFWTYFRSSDYFLKLQIK